MKKKTPKTILLILVVVVALLVSLNEYRPYLRIEEAFKDISTILSRLIIYPTNTLALEKKSILQEEMDSSLQEEINELKKLLDLNTKLNQYSFVNATIISRNNTYWFNTITLDKGSKDNLKKNMAVVTKDGLIGKVIKVSKKTSEVKLLTADDITYKTSIIIRVNEKDNYAILSGYDRKDNLLKVTGIDKSIKVNKGDKVITSGLGNLERGLYIGEVEKSSIDRYNLGQTVYIKPAVDYNNLHYVSVLVGKNK